MFERRFVSRLSIVTATLAILAMGLVLPGFALGHEPAATGTSSGGTAAGSAVDTAKAFDGFDAWVEEIMEEWLVPGLGVSVVKDGEVVMARGYGYRNHEEKLPATGDTLFAIGSNSKSFTAAVVGELVEEGLIEWDRPVRDYLPTFRLYDEVASNGMTPRDLLSHTSGLPRHDLAWLASGKTRQELFDMLRYLEPSESFRSKFQYQNLMFMSAGYLAGQVTGTTWEEQVQQRLFDRIGMKRSNFSVDKMQKDDDFSYAYGATDRVIERIPYRNIDAIGPAGSINSSALEMSKWVRALMDDGKLGEEQVLSASTSRAMQSPQMVISGPLLASVKDGDELGDPSYGLGLMVSSYRGHKYVRHGGGIDGFISAMEWLPEDRIGVVVLSNTGASGTVPGLVVRNVFDRLLGMEPIDWAAKAREAEAKGRDQVEEVKKTALADRKQGTAPSHDLGDYVASYEHDGYGVAEVEQVGDRLQVSVVGLGPIPLEHFHYDIFLVPYDLPGVLEGFGGSKISFSYNKQGNIDRISIPLEPSIDDIVFERQGDESMSDPKFLEKMVGSYEMSGTEISVVLEAGSLRLTVPGQPTYTLVPDRGTSFGLKGLDGFGVEFDLAEGAESANAVTFRQPNGSFKAERK